MSPTFSLTDGGPFYRLVVRLRMLRASGMVRSWWLAAALWSPLALGELARQALGLPEDPTLHDFAVHTRLLVGLPLMFVAERLLEPACRGAIRSLYEGKLADPGHLDRIVARGERLRDAWWVELALATLAIAGGQLALWQVTGSGGMFYGGQHVGTWSFPRVWYSLVALPVVQFVMFRWLWRWMIWCFMLVRISRLPLAALATHPDHAAGLAPLAAPITGLAVFVLATSSVLAGAWGTELVAHRTTVQALVPGFLTYLAIVTAIAILPLLLFCTHLFRARRVTLLEYSEFAHQYMKRFHERWVASKHDPDEFLGTSDIQSLADIGSAFEVIETTRIVVFGPRQLVELWLFAAVPMLPLLANVLTFQQVAKRLFTTVLGGLPI